MPDLIRLLPDAIANQIAAGEVVQRPASVVKELLENAVDASASEIKVIIKDAGKQLIQVMDNGKGMSATDARLCFERHATSKIREAQDLFSIRSMGFRGEAMASIAAVSQVEMRSREEHSELGTLILIEASEVKTHEATSCPKGTSVAVKNLFFNTPARRNFLKSNPVETRHIIDEFQRVSLAYPQIAFSFFQNDLETYRLLPGKLSQRICALFGNQYKEQLVPCSEETSLVKVTGYVGTPAFAKKTRGEQFFFVNNRFIKNGYLHHAVMTGFSDLISTDQFPFYVLNLEIDPAHIDINVHPTKTEIKFDDERSVYGVVQSAVRQALGRYNITPPIDFEADVNFTELMGAARPIRHDFSPGPEPSKIPANFGGEHIKRKDQSGNWELLFRGTEISKHFEISGESEASSTRTFASSINTLPKADLLAAENSGTLFQVHKAYILSQVKSGIMFVDQESATERILYEKYLKALDHGTGSSQQILFPEQLELNPSDFSLVQQMDAEIRALGFEFDVFGRNALLIRGIPSDVPATNACESFEGLIEQFKHNKSELSLDKSENLARSLAKRTSWKPGKSLNSEEMEGLINQLFGCKNPNFSPSGKRTYILFELNRIAALFN
jgi:DNA mismatch repair protein MutL